MFLELIHTDVGYKSPLIIGANSQLCLGEMILLIGDNGVGKTTLIKTIMNEITPLSGTILLNKKNVKTLDPLSVAQHIATVFSKPTIPSGYKVEDLIALGKYIHYPYYFELNLNDKKEIRGIMKMFGLEIYQNCYLHKLSDGNLQKAFIARALAQNSPMIILDEPTTHLDEKNKIMVLKILRKLAKEEGKLILFSSHDWRLAKEFSDKIWYISQNRLHSGVSEDIIRTFPELFSAVDWNENSSFSAPCIQAPDREKGWLLSFLRKSFPMDLSGYTFSFEVDCWHISCQGKTFLARTFAEILDNKNMFS